MKRSIRKAALPVMAAFTMAAAPVAAEITTPPQSQINQAEAGIGNYRYAGMNNLSVNEMRGLMDLHYKRDFSREKKGEQKKYLVCTMGQDYTLNFNAVANLPEYSSYSVDLSFRLMTLDVMKKTDVLALPETDDFKNCSALNNKKATQELKDLTRLYNNNSFNQIEFHEEFFKKLSNHIKQPVDRLYKSATLKS